MKILSQICNQKKKKENAKRVTTTIDLNEGITLILYIY